MTKAQRHKVVRYFLVAGGGNVRYIKMECDLPFRVREGIAQLREAYPKPFKITHLAKEKAEKFLELIHP